jgi:hypothetical protein
MARITRRAFVRSSSLVTASTTLLPRPGLAQAKEVPLPARLHKVEFTCELHTVIVVPV